MPVEEDIVDLIARFSGADRQQVEGLAIADLPRWGSLPALQFLGAVERDLGIIASLRDVLEAESVAAIVNLVRATGTPS